MKAAKVSSIDNPSIKDLLNMEHWALMNNLHVHPAFMKACKKKNSVLIISYSVVMLVIIIIALVVK